MISGVDSLWRKSLPHLRSRGWQSTVDGLSAEHFDAADRYESALVLGALQQKFGLLDDAARSLGFASLSDDPAMAIQAKSNLAKVQSQLGNQATAALLLERLHSASATGDELPVSSYWRLGFAYELTGNSAGSGMLMAQHAEMAISEHPSQMANNLVFRCVSDLHLEETSPRVVRERLARAYILYLQGSIVAGAGAGVSFVSVAKSAIVPLVLAGYTLILEGQGRSALTQLAIARQIMNFERISWASEGLSELHQILDRSPTGRLVLLIIGDESDGSHRDHLTRMGYTAYVVDRALEESRFRVAEHFSTGNFLGLWVEDGEIDRAPIAIGSRGVHLLDSRNAWRGRVVDVLALLGHSVMDIDGLDGAASIPLRTEYAQRVARFVIAVATDDVALEVGYLVRTFGPRRVVLIDDQSDGFATDWSSLGCTILTSPSAAELSGAVRRMVHRETNGQFI